MFYHKASSLNELYVDVIHYVLAHGHSVSPRNLDTIEVCPAHLVLTEPRKRLLSVENREINPAFAVAEAIWILSGTDAPWIYQFNRKLLQYTDAGTLKGAYGPRIRNWQGCLDQLDAARRLLIRQPSTRQAVIQIYDPAIDYKGYHDVACTLNYHFLIRENRLHMYTTMRSQDIWLGMPYDIFTNTLIQELMAGWLNCEIGEYHHRVSSLHLYRRDIKKAMLVELGDIIRDSYEDYRVKWDEFDSLLENVLNGRTVANQSWRNFSLVLESYRLWKAGNIRGALELANVVTGNIGNLLRRWFRRRL